MEGASTGAEPVQTGKAHGGKQVGIGASSDALPSDGRELEGLRRPGHRERGGVCFKPGQWICCDEDGVLVSEQKLF